MKYYAVIDTNVLVSFFLTRNTGSPIVKVIEAIKSNTIVPMYNETILSEYTEVLQRERFGIASDKLDEMISLIKTKGINTHSQPVTALFPDPDDIVFYEVAMSRDDSYLVTGNLKHFPQNGRVVSPAEMLYIIEHEGKNPQFLSDSESGYYLSIPLEEINAIIREVRIMTSDRMEQYFRL